MFYLYSLLSVITLSFIMPLNATTPTSNEDLISMSVTPNSTHPEKVKPAQVTTPVDHNVYAVQKKNANPDLGYVNLEGLCWRAGESNFVYAIDNGKELQDPSNPDFSGKMLRLKPKWSCGVRLNFGLSKIYDWMIEGDITYLHSKNSVVNNSSTINPFRFPYESIEKTIAKSRLNYQTYDLGLASNTLWEKSMVFKPYFGFRGVVIKNVDKVIYYSDMYSTSIPFSAVGTYKVYTKFWGAGPRIGFKGMYRCGDSGFEFFGDGSANLDYGKNHIKQYVTDDREDRIITDLTIREKFYDLKLGFQILLGANYKYYFHNHKRAVTCEIAWETNYWLDQNNYFNEFNTLMSQGALLLYGINLGIGVEF